MEFHETANIFPLLEGEEYRALRDDIAANGLIEDIWTYEGKILDGRNRYIACLDLGIEPRYREWKGNGSPVAFVVSLNLKRRHLTSSQRAVVALDIEKYLAEEAKTRQVAGAKLGASITNNGRLMELFPQGETKQGAAAEQAADIIGTNSHYVTDAKNIATNAPDLLEKVRTGEYTIPQAKRELSARTKSETPPMTGKYRIIYADPPWKYGNRIDEAMPGSTTPETHYPCMSIDDLCNLPVKELAEDNAVLFLWVTSPLLEECFPVIHSWGFKYKTSFVWDKIGHNYGHYNSVRHELLLICTRGSCTPDNHKLYDSVLSIEKSDIHSEKPEEFRKIIDDLYQYGNRIELFARRQVDGWECWGNEPTRNITN